MQLLMFHIMISSLILCVSSKPLNRRSRSTSQSNVFGPLIESGFVPLAPNQETPTKTTATTPKPKTLFPTPFPIPDPRPSTPTLPPSFPSPFPILDQTSKKPALSRFPPGGSRFGLYRGHGFGLYRAHPNIFGRPIPVAPYGDIYHGVRGRLAQQISRSRTGSAYGAVPH